MEVAMSLNHLVRLPISSSRTHEDSLLRHSFFFSTRISTTTQKRVRQYKHLVVEAKGKKGMAGRQYQRTAPALPKIEDDGNPRFVIFIRMANVTSLFLSLNKDSSFSMNS